MSEGWVAMQASLVPRNAAVLSLNALILGRGITSTRGRNTAEDKVLRVFCASASVRKSHDEGQCNIETCNVVVVETTYRPPNPRSPNSYGFVGHYLGACSQAISFTSFDCDAKIRRLDHFRRHLTNYSRGVSFGKRVGLNDDCWSRFAEVACRSYDNDVTASHVGLGDRAYRTRRPLQSSSAPRPPRSE